MKYQCPKCGSERLKAIQTAYALDEAVIEDGKLKITEWADTDTEECELVGVYCAECSETVPRSEYECQGSKQAETSKKEGIAMWGFKCDRCGYTTQNESDHVVTDDGEHLCLDCYSQGRGLYLASFRWLDGESERHTKRFVKARDMDEAKAKADGYLSDMFGEGTAKEGEWYISPIGYPAVKVDAIWEIENLEDAVRKVGEIA